LDGKQPLSIESFVSVPAAGGTANSIRNLNNKEKKHLK
jgi:hypothetical protein